MIERAGDLWEIATAGQAAVVITTNGSVRKDGCAVMGTGCALEAKKKFPGIDHDLGSVIASAGNHVTVLRDFICDGISLLTFPVKAEWHYKAEVGLIEHSARELVNICDSLAIRKVVMPRPGCGSGRLRWADVRPVLAAILDDRFVVVHRKGE